MDPAAPAETAPPLLSAHPVYVQRLVMIEAALAGILGGALAAFIGATLLVLLLGMLGFGVSGGGFYSTFLVLGLALTPAAWLEIKKRALARTVYRFHDDHFEYQDFRFGLERRRGRVRYRDIRDVYARPSILQARFGLTTLYILIPGFATQMERGLQGLRMPDLSAGDGLRDKVVDLIESSNRRAMQQASQAPPAETPPAVAAQP